jgi:hypothetical protein
MQTLSLELGPCKTLYKPSDNDPFNTRPRRQGKQGGSGPENPDSRGYYEALTLTCWFRLQSAKHQFRGFARISIHATLAVLAMMAVALSKAKAGQFEKVRICARRIA